MATVESYLTRELDLRFIDARRITAEAKLSLGITGYPTNEQIGFLKQEAIRIFNSLPTSEQSALQKMHFDFEATKTPTSSLCGDSDHTSSNGSSRSSHSRRRGSIVTFFRSRGDT